jgi:outer membrane protein assembly factor BamB
MLVASARADETLTRTVLSGDSPSAALRLESARKLARGGQFAEAIDEYQRLLEEAGDKLAPLNEREFVQVRWLCHLDLAALPADGLRLYRNRVDAQARKWFEQGAATREVALLRRVVDDAFCSRVGDRALDVLGDVAFERGQFIEAGRWWSRLVRPVDAPRAVHTLDLVYPDSQLDAARTHAKQVLARLFQSEAEVSDAALRETLEAYRRLHPDAAGALAGRTGKYVETLQALLEQRSNLAPEAPAWTSFAGGPGRNLVLPPEPGDPNRLTRLVRRWRFNLATRAPVDDMEQLDQERSSAAARSLAFAPLFVGDQVLVADARYVTAYDLHTGRSTVWFDLAAEHGGANPDLSLPAHADLRYSLTLADGCVFARLGTQCLGPDRRANECESFLACLTIKPNARGEHLRWLARPDTGNREGAVFEGAPLVADGRVYVATTRFGGGRNVTAISCYPVQADGTPPQRWRQDVCETPEPNAKEERCRHHLLTLAGPNVVYCSHSGAVVAVDAVTGRHVWARRYPSRGLTVDDQPSPRDLVPAVHAGGRLFVAPADYDRIQCLDPATGQLLWERDKIEVVHLLGVARGRLIFTTPQGIRAVNATTGADRDGWVEPDIGDLPPFGRGFLAGGLVFWPTRHKLYVLSQTDGQQPDDLHPGPWQDIPAGNLAYGDGCLAVAGNEVLTTYVPPAWPRSERVKDGREQPSVRPVPVQTNPEVPRTETSRVESAAPADLPLPLLDAWQITLAPGECLLPAHPDGSRTDAVLSARAQELNRRDLSTGRVRWSQSLPFVPEWAGQHADTMVAAGPGGVGCLRLDDGAVRWSYHPPERQSLGDFRLTATHLFCLLDGRRLIALDLLTGTVAWTVAAPSAALRLPYPSGHFLTYQAGPDCVVAQTAGGKLWVLDRRTGSRRHQFLTTRAPWPQPPLFLGAGQVCLVTEPHTVFLLDPAAGKELARPPLLAPTTLTGRASLVAGNGDILLLVTDRNIGPTLQRLDGRTGNALWPDERLLGNVSVAPGGMTFDHEAVYCVSGGVLSALALADGKLIWKVALPEAGRNWQVLRTADHLVAYPADVGARTLACRALFGSLTLLEAFPPPGGSSAGVPVLFCDPKTGQLIQRLNLLCAARAIAWGCWRPGEFLLPQFRLDKPALLLQLSARGLVAAVPGRAWGRIPVGSE